MSRLTDHILGKVFWAAWVEDTAMDDGHWDMGHGT